MEKVIPKSVQQKYVDMIYYLDEDNHPEALVQALQLLYKLFINIANNPMEQKYRSIKTTNNTLKTKVFNIQKINQLLEILGFQLDSTKETYTLPDACLGNLISCIGDHHDCTTLIEAKLESDEAYNKQLEIMKNKKELQQQQQKDKQFTDKLKQLNDYDKIEAKTMKAQGDSKAIDRGFGGVFKSAQDCGIKKGGGG